MSKIILKLYILCCSDCGMVKEKKPNKESNMDLLKIIAVIILPPVGVFFQVGIGMHFWLNILLTLLGYIPGIVHAIWVIAKSK